MTGRECMSNTLGKPYMMLMLPAIGIETASQLGAMFFQLQVFADCFGVCWSKSQISPPQGTFAPDPGAWRLGLAPLSKVHDRAIRGYALSTDVNVKHTPRSHNSTAAPLSATFLGELWTLHMKLSCTTQVRILVNLWRSAMEPALGLLTPPEQQSNWTGQEYYWWRTTPLMRQTCYTTSLPWQTRRCLVMVRHASSSHNSENSWRGFTNHTRLSAITASASAFLLETQVNYRTVPKLQVGMCSIVSAYTRAPPYPRPITMRQTDSSRMYRLASWRCRPSTLSRFS